MFEKYVQSALAKIPTGENFVAVLKGIPSDLAEDLAAAAANPLKYFNAAVSAGRKNFHVRGISPAQRFSRRAVRRNFHAQQQPVHFAIPD